jgi:hypothetical protein
MNGSYPAAAQPTTPIILMVGLPTPCVGPTTTASAPGNSDRLLGVAQRYGADRLEAACRRALDFDLLDVYPIQRILEQGLESQSEPQPIAGQQAALKWKFLRPAEHFLSDQGGPDADPT